MNKATYDINKLREITPEAKNTISVIGNGGLDLTIETILKAVSSNVEAITEFAQAIQGNSLAETSYNIWHWIKQNTEYQKDKPKIEEIRTPQRLISDAKGDCDDYSIFAATILKALGYDPYFFIVAFKGSQSYGHIYVGVENFIIDGVMKDYGIHPENITKTQIVKLNGNRKVYNRSPKTFNDTAMRVELLAGYDFGDQDINNFVNSELERLNGLDGQGQLTEDEKEDLSKIRTLKLLEGNAHRDFLLAVMPAIAGIDNELNVYFHNEEDAIEADVLLDEFQKLQGLGDLDGLDDWFKKAKKWATKKKAQIKKFHHKQVKKAKEFHHKQVKKVEKVWKKTKNIAKKIAKITVKISLAPARAAILLLLRLNFLKWASRLWLSYLPLSKARAIGMDLKAFKKLVDFRRKFEKFYEKAGGNKKAIFAAVSKKGARKAKEKYGIDGLGSATGTAAASASASPFLIFLGTAWKSIKGVFSKLFKKIDFKKAAKKIGKSVACTIERNAKKGFQNPEAETEKITQKFEDRGGRYDKPKGKHRSSTEYKTTPDNDNKSSMLLPLAIGGILLAFTLL